MTQVLCKVTARCRCGPTCLWHAVLAAIAWHGRGRYFPDRRCARGLRRAEGDPEFARALLAAADIDKLDEFLEMQVLQVFDDEG